MRKKFSLALVLLFGAILFSGCETTKGIAAGAAQGAAQDSKDIWQNIKQADSWIQKNLW